LQITDYVNISAKTLDEDFLIPIYNEYLNAYRYCRNYTDSHLNLMGILFHELMYLSSSLVYSKVWNENNNIFQYPFLGYRKNKFHNHESLFNYFTRKKHFLSIFSNLISNSSKKIGIINPGLDLKSITLALINNNIKFSFINKIKIDIPNYDLQLSIIINTVKKIANRYNINFDLYQLKESLNYSFKKFKLYEDIDFDILLIGSPVKIQSRLAAASALSKNLPVICIDHGNETGTEDNPAWGYDEQSFCTHFIGFGSAGEEAIINSQFLKPLHHKLPKYIASNSTQIKNNCSSKIINKLPNNINQCRLAYVPYKLMGAERLGPFASISDEDYIKWQEIILANFPNIIYKAHPKESINRKLNSKNLVTDPIEKCLDIFDVFIIDNVVSTAFANIASTDKPIIYFNIGFGNLSKTAEAVIKERVLWIDIDLTDPGGLYVKVENQNNKKCVNNYTKQFSLANHNQTREETVLKTIQKIMA